MNAAPLICTGASGWPITKLSKMKLRAVIAARYKEKPEISITVVFFS
jgi:hypothetical protein